MDKDLFNNAELIGQQLLKKNEVIAVAESCTGGWIAKCFTDVAGSSNWFDRGFVVYNAQAKQQMLGISPEIIKQNGEVSEPTVLALAQAVLANSRASISVAISGIAGPGGGSTDKPVGLIWFAWAHAEQKMGVVSKVQSHARKMIFSGDRESVRRESVLYAMQGILELLSE